MGRLAWFAAGVVVGIALAEAARRADERRRDARHERRQALRDAALEGDDELRAVADELGAVGFAGGESC